MSDDFEYRNDPEIAKAAAGAPREVCAVKVDTFKQCAAFVRNVAFYGPEGPMRREARALAGLLDRVGITPDFEPNVIDKAA